MNKTLLKYLGLVAGAVVVILIAFSVLSKSKSGAFGSISNIDLTVGSSTLSKNPATGRTGGTVTGNFVCGATSSVALAPLSGRAYFRFTNFGATSTAFIGLVATSTAGNVDGSFVNLSQGIALAPNGATSTGVNYFDSGEAGINWTENFACVAQTTGTVISYIQGN